MREKLQSANLRFRREKELEVQDAKLLKALEMNVEKQRMQYERYRGLLYAAHPELRIQRAEFPRQFWKGLTKSLPQEKAFLQYVVTEDTTFLFLVAAGEPISVYQIDLGSKRNCANGKRISAASGRSGSCISSQCQTALQLAHQASRKTVDRQILIDSDSGRPTVGSTVSNTG